MLNWILGWVTAQCLIWLCWALGAPIVAEAARTPIPRHDICPYLIIKHGVGSDLRTFTEVRDLCSEQ